VRGQQRPGGRAAPWHTDAPSGLPSRRHVTPAALRPPLFRQPLPVLLRERDRGAPWAHAAGATPARQPLAAACDAAPAARRARPRQPTPRAPRARLAPGAAHRPACRATQTSCVTASATPCWTHASRRTPTARQAQRLLPQPWTLLRAAAPAALAKHAFKCIAACFAAPLGAAGAPSHAAPPVLLAARRLRARPPSKITSFWSSARCVCHHPGSRQQAAGSRQQAAGSRQQAAGSRQQAAGSRQAAASMDTQPTHSPAGVAARPLAPMSQRAAWACAAVGSG
jgi:hypothetical protein